MNDTHRIADLRRAVKQAQDDLAEAEEEEERKRDCPVCGEPYSAPCFIDRHEVAARRGERQRLATAIENMTVEQVTDAFGDGSLVGSQKAFAEWLREGGNAS